MVTSQRTIKGTFSPAKEYKAVILYKVTPTISNYINSCEIKKDGSFKFQMDSTATKGMYRIVYGLPQEDYNFDVIYNGKEDIELVFKSETGVEFLKSSENKIIAHYTSSMAKVSQTIGNYYRQKSQDTLALVKIFETQRKAQSDFEDIAKNTIALNFVKANRPYIPKKYQDVATYIKNLEKHYFDYIDFKNTSLQSSSFLEQRMLNYIFGRNTDNENDVENYKRNIAVFVSKAKDAPAAIKKNLLATLWQQMVDLELEDVANFIAEDYLMGLAVELNDQDLLRTLMVYKDTSIGAIAPDFSYEILRDGKKVTRKLSELNSAENYIIVFWSSACSHCLDEMPQLHDFISSFEKGKFKILAIALEDDRTNWKTMVQSFPKFAHIYGKDKWENAISTSYGVSATPTYFILDKNKIIVNKPQDIYALKAFFNSDK